jgi:hypothetical protein
MTHDEDTMETIEFEQDRHQTINNNNSENIEPNLPKKTVNQTHRHEEMKSLLLFIYFVRQQAETFAAGLILYVI